MTLKDKYLHFRGIKHPSNPCKVRETFLNQFLKGRNLREGSLKFNLTCAVCYNSNLRIVCDLKVKNFLCIKRSCTRVGLQLICICCS